MRRVVGHRVPLTPRDPAARGATVGRPRSRSMPGSPLGWLERAAQRFNTSSAPRTVAGLTRTLGQPKVSVGAAAGSPSEVRVTVAWDLCWYQWGIEVGDERRPLFEIARGEEIDQLDPAARQWNARIGADGELVLGVAVA